MICVRGLYPPEDFEKTGIVFWHHDAETDEFAVQTLEGAAVTYHQIVFDAPLKCVERGDVWVLDFEEQEIGIGVICPESRKFFYFRIHPFALGKDEAPRFLNILFVPEHDFSRKCTDAVQ